MISALCLCAALLVADPTTATQAVPRPFHEVQAEIRELLKSEALGADLSSRARPIVRMCALHGELLADPRYEQSDTLKEYRIRLWSRLRRVKDELKRELALSGDAHDRAALEDQRLLEAADPTSLAAADAVPASLALLDQAQAGPGLFVGLGGGAVVGDSGPELVELIERTINPDFWDVNGGPGSIVYFAPLRCLVVRATSQTHERVGGVLGGLREAAR